MSTSSKLALCVTADDYAVFAGPDWPSYADFLTGATSNDPFVAQEIETFKINQLKQGTWFPIRTATSCQSKWTWSTLWLNRLETSSCHRVINEPVDLDNFDNFHNTPRKIADRNLMLQGQWPGHGCEYCRDIEQAGGWSDRQHNLEIRGLTPMEVELDPTATHVSPKIIEMFAQNTCNLSCVYCFAGLSSKIEQENKKFGEFNSQGVTIPVVNIPTAATKEYFDKFLDWLDRNVQSIVRLHLLGGETFLQHNLMTAVIEILQRRPNPNLELCVFSNLNVPDRYWDLYTNQIKDLQSAGNIRVFDLTSSIDCWGPEQEYVRYGLNLDRFESRFAWAAEQGSWLRLNVNQTITSQTIRTMPALIQKIDQYSRYRYIGHYFQFVTGPQTFQHPKHYAWSFWQNDFERIFQTMPTRTPEHQEAIVRMRGLEKLLQSHTEFNYAEIKKLHVYLDEIDRRRGTDWRSLFAYLDIHP